MGQFLFFGSLIHSELHNVQYRVQAVHIVASKQLQVVQITIYHRFYMKYITVKK